MIQIQTYSQTKYQAKQMEANFSRKLQAKAGQQTIYVQVRLLMYVGWWQQN